MTRGNRQFRAVIIMFLIILFVWLFVFLPPYEKLVYSKSAARSSADITEKPENNEGYKGGGDIPVLDAAASVETDKDPEQLFVLKIDVRNLKPMGIYRPAAYETNVSAYETNSLKVMLLRTKESYAQYYMAEFANGEKIPVLLNNRLVKIPGSGTVTLPIGKWRMDSNLAKVSSEPLADEWYIDAASGFEKGADMQAFSGIRTIAAAGLGILLVICAMIVMFVRRR